MVKFKLNLFYKELLLFASTLILGIFSASRLLASSQPLASQGEFQIQDLIILAIFVIVLLLLRRRKKVLSFIYKFFLILIIISGSQIVFGSFLSYPINIISTLAVISVFLLYKNVFTHNLGIILGIAGVGAIIGLGITPRLALFLLLILSFYDILAVYKTKHMVQMAKDMIESGAIFGFVIPSQIRGFLYSRNEARSKMDEFMVLGSGDIGLPLIMACSLVPISLSSAIITAIFSLLGLFATHMIFVNQSQRRPMAALPPIATMTIIGYLITLI